MTKKMFICQRSRSDFLIAEIGRPGFTSLQTGKKHAKALVVYTGVDLTPGHLLEKCTQQGSSFTEADAEYTLSNVVKLKIGSAVKHESRDGNPPLFELCGD